jgi:hypothetical protein
MRKLTKSAARKMAAARKTCAGGRPRKETPCRKCGATCASETLSRVHC